MAIEPVNIKILVLSHGRLRDGLLDNGFGLDRLARILSEAQGEFVLLEVTRKYMDYDKNDLRDILREKPYDEAWLFGDLSPLNSTSNECGASPAPRDLHPHEVTALQEFMMIGGVFATGDHQDLGGALNGQTTRIRLMRKWFFDPCPPGGLEGAAKEWNGET